MEEFDIVEYIGSIIGYPIPRKTVERIVDERGLSDVDDWSMITRRERNLVIADMLFYLFTSPSNTGSKTRSHGDFTITIGGIILTDKNDIYALMMQLYQNPDEEIWQALSNIGGCSWKE